MLTAIIDKKKKKGTALLDTTKLLIATIFIVLVFVPLINMFLQVDAKSIQSVISSPNFLQVVINSLTVGIIATLITVVLAYLLALVINRTSIKGKGALGIIFTIPMLIPSISLGMGLVMILGNNGILTRFFGLNFNIYGMWGIVTGSVLYAFPVAFLMLSDIMHYEDAAPYEAANVLGISKGRQFFSITLPYLRRPLISVVFAIFTLIVTDYGVPMAVGGNFRTIPYLMYEEVVGMLDYGKGAVWGSLLLIPAVVAFIFDFLNKDKGNAGFVTKPFTPSKSKLACTLSYVFSGAVVVFTMLPIASFVFLAFVKGYPNTISFTFDNITNVMQSTLPYLQNSLSVALFVALLGTLITFVTAYLSARVSSKTSRFLHMASITSAAIPGLVLGLSYAMTFKSTMIYNTLFILVMVNIVHFTSSPYLMMYNSLSKINQNLESVGETLGIGKFRMIKDVFLPQNTTTLCEMFVYFFVNSMMTISAVSFLSTYSTKPLSLMINQYQTLSKPELSAVISITILAVNIAVKAIFHVLKKKGGKRA